MQQILLKESRDQHARKRRKIIFTIGAVVCIICLIVIVIAVTVTLKRQSSSSESPSNTNDDWLPMLIPTGGWNILSYTYGRENVIKVNDTSMQVNYPQGSFQDTGGFKFYAQPHPFPTSSACLNYKLTLADNFDFVKGGKLPGFWIGNKGANGGRSLNDSSSCRVMWRADGVLEAYIYLPSDSIVTQDYTDQIISNSDYGDSLWRGLLGNLSIENSNNITICVGINSFNKNLPKNNGKLSVTINNITKNFTKIMWITKSNLKLSGLLMNTFFGGDDDTWASSSDTYAVFSDFTITPYVM